MTSPVLSESRLSWRQVWLPAMLILGSPWLMAAISVSIAVLSRSADSPIGSNDVQWIAHVNWPIAVAGSAYGGLFIRGPVPIRVAVVIATMIYGAVIYVVLVTLPHAFGLQIGL